MATETINYKLTKPDKNDFYDIDIFNENMSVIDALIASKAAQVHGHALKDVAGLESALAGKSATGHTHNYAGSNTSGGAASTANALATQRKFKIGNTSKDFNGTIDVTWTLDEIGAPPKIHGHAISDITSLQEVLNDKSASTHTHSYAGADKAGGVANSAKKLETKRKINGVEFDGTGNVELSFLVPIDITSQTVNVNDYNITNGFRDGNWVCRTSGGAANITNIPLSGAFKLSLERLRHSSDTDYIQRQTIIYSHNKTIYTRWCNSGVWTAWGLIEENGSAKYATQLAAAREITIGDKKKGFNGSEDVSYSLAEIGALPSTGGTLTGPITNNTASATGLLKTNLNSSSYLRMHQGDNAVVNHTAAYGAHKTLFSCNSTDGRFAIYALNRNMGFSYQSNASIAANESIAEAYLRFNDQKFVETNCTLNLVAGARFRMKPGERNNEPIDIQVGDVNGDGLFITCGGLTVIGSGEFPSNYKNLADRFGNVVEHMVVGSDRDIYFYSDGNTIANRKGMRFSTGGNLFPETDAYGSVGTKGNRWDAMHARTFNGDLEGKLATPRTITIGNTAKNFDGSANVAWSVNELISATIESGDKYRTGFGHEALMNFNSNFATAFGYRALRTGNGEGNTAFGYQALTKAAGSYNTGVGIGSMDTLTSGSYNCALGMGALGSITTGSNNTAIGWRAGGAYGSAITTHTNCTAIGSDAQITGNNQVQLGNSSTTTYTYGAVQNRSDMRDKTDIDVIDPRMKEFVLNLVPRQFRWDYREDYQASHEDIERKTETLFKRKAKKNIGRLEKLKSQNQDFETEEEKVVFDTAISGIETEIERIRQDCKLQAHEELYKSWEELETIKDGSRKRNRLHMGFIAQEVETLADELGVDYAGLQHSRHDGEGQDVYHMSMDELIPVMVLMLQEMNQKINGK